MKRLFIFTACIFSATLFAQTQTTFPDQCKISDTKFTENNVLLFSKKITSRVYAITNTSKGPIWLNHESKNPGAGMGAGFASQLYPNHWSALLVDGTDFSVSCHQQDKKGGMTVVPCQKVVSVCEFENIHTTKSGEYWVVENVLQPQLISHIKARGF